MDSPKGLGLYNGLLYVADLTNVVVIDMESGKLIRTINRSCGWLSNEDICIRVF